MRTFKYCFVLIIILTAFSCKKDYTNQWVSLMPGKSMAGWKKDSDKRYFEQLDSTLLLTGKGALYYSGKIQEAKFKNFEFSADIKTQADAVAGLWFHSGLSSGYQVLINNTPDSEEQRKTGSLCAVRNVYKSMAANDQWFNLKIRVVGKHITVRVNDILMVDYVEPEAPYRTEDNNGKLIAQGSFALENYTNKQIVFRNIRVMPLVADALDRTDAVDEKNDEIIRLQQANFPVIDFHVHLKGWNQKQAMDHSRKIGISYGIAPNCGIGFPVTSDDDIYTFIDTTRNLPCFMAMQGEGREWVNTFSKEAREQFDYVFTDAMTFTDHKGRRTRLWIPEEVFIDIDQEKYMDIIVDRAVKVLKEEPIDIYVNPTFLPDEMTNAYDALWTKERYMKIINTLVQNNIALEINARYRIPNEAIIRAAKDAGVRFAFGTNNATPDMGKLDYCIEMMKKCGITKHDMFFPIAKMTGE